jgi:hypothetical protein
MFTLQSNLNSLQKFSNTKFVQLLHYIVMSLRYNIYNTYNTYLLVLHVSIS